MTEVCLRSCCQLQHQCLLARERIKTSEAESEASHGEAVRLQALVDAGRQAQLLNRERTEQAVQAAQRELDYSQQSFLTQSKRDKQKLQTLETRLVGLQEALTLSTTRHVSSEQHAASARAEAEELLIVAQEQLHKAQAELQGVR